MAATTTLYGRRARKPVTQSERFPVARMARAPCINNVRKYTSPRLEIPNWRMRPPVPVWRGTNPSQAANSRPQRTGADATRGSGVCAGVLRPPDAGVVHLRGGSADQAETELKHILDLHPDDPVANYFHGESLHAERKDVEAIATFKAVLKSGPEHAPSVSALARLSAKKGQASRI